MNIQKRILSKAAVKYYKQAEKELIALEGQRKALGAIFLRKPFSIGGVYGVLSCSEHSLTITLWSADGQIVLWTDGEFGLLDYKTGALVFEGTDLYVSKMHPYFNGVIHFSGIYDITRDLTPIARPDADGAVFCNLEEYQIEWGKTIDGFQAKTAAGIISMGGVATLDGYVPVEWLNVSQQLLTVAQRRYLSAYNDYYIAEFWHYNFKNHTAFQGQLWVPGITYIGPNDGAPVGFYVSGSGPYNKVQAQLLCPIVPKRLAVKRPYGYVELVSGVVDSGSDVQVDNPEGLPITQFNFYAEELPLGFPRRNFRYERMQSGNIYCGTILEPPTPRFSLPAATGIPGPITIADVWSTRHQLPDGSNIDMYGYVFSDGVYGVFGCMRGYHTALWYGFYIGHSVSEDGRTVAIFEGEPPAITRVNVYDLTKPDNELVYSSGQSVANREYKIGSLLPKTETAIPLALTEEPTTSIVGNITYNHNAPFFGGAHFSSSNIGPVEYWKLKGRNGTIIEGNMMVDNCYRWTYTKVVITNPEHIRIEIDGMFFEGDADSLVSRLPYLLWAKTEAENKHFALGQWAGEPQYISGPMSNGVPLSTSCFEGCVIEKTSSLEPYLTIGADTGLIYINDAVLPVVSWKTTFGTIVPVTEDSAKLTLGDIDPCIGIPKHEVQAIDSCNRGDILKFQAVPPDGPIFKKEETPTGWLIWAESGVEPFTLFVKNKNRPDSQATETLIAINDPHPIEGCLSVGWIVDACGNEGMRVQGKTITPDPVITGEEAVEVGNLYFVTGGESPYKWTFEGGSFVELGPETAPFIQITEVTGCGMGTIQVQDGCERIAEMAVRLPEGQWVFKSSNYPCSITSASTFFTHLTIVSGNTMTYFFGNTYGRCWWDSYSCNVDGGCNPISEAVQGCGPYYDWTLGNCAYITREDLWEWECP